MLSPSNNWNLVGNNNLFENSLLTKVIQKQPMNIKKRFPYLSAFQNMAQPSA